MPTLDYTADANFAILSGGTVSGGSVSPDADYPTLAAGDYFWVLKCDPLPGSDNYARISWADTETGAWYYYQGAWNSDYVSSNGQGFNLYDSSDTVVASASMTADTQSTVGNSVGVDRRLAQQFTLSAETTLKDLAVNVVDITGNGCDGNLKLEIYTDTAGDPDSGTLVSSTSGLSLTAAGTQTLRLAQTGLASPEFLVCEDKASDLWTLDATASYYHDMSTAAATVTGSPTIEYQYEQRTADPAGADAATANGNITWNGSWLSEAQLQAVADSLTDEHLALKVRMTPSAGTDSFDAFSIDTAAADVTGPSAPGDAFAYYDNDDGATIDVAIKCTHGDDTEDNYDGISFGYYDTADSTWYYEQSDGSWAASESYASLNVVAGTELAEELAWLANLPDTASQVRITAWDTLGNNSSRTDVAVVALGTGDLPDPENVLSDDTVDGEAGLFVNLDPAHVEADIQWGANGTEFTGTLVPAGDPPPLPTLTVADNGDASGATATVSGSDPASDNEIRVAAGAGGAWSTAGSRTGDGEVPLSLAPGMWWVSVRSSTPGGVSSPAPEAVVVTDGTVASSQEMRTHLRALLLADPTIASTLAGPEAVILAWPEQIDAIPCITLAESEDGRDPDRPGRTVRVWLCCHSESQPVNDTLASRIEALLEGWAPRTDHWRVLYGERLGRSHSAARPRGRADRVRRETTLEFRFLVLGADESVSFTSAETVVELPVPAQSETLQEARAQADGFTAAGSRYVGDGGPRPEVRSLRFVGLSGTERDALRDFFHATAVGMQTLFTYTDPAGTDRTVRFAEPELSFSRGPGSTWDVGVVLEEAI
jgi:hypothetical protein